MGRLEGLCGERGGSGKGGGARKPEARQSEGWGRLRRSADAARRAGPESVSGTADTARAAAGGVRWGRARARGRPTTCCPPADRRHHRARVRRADEGGVPPNGAAEGFTGTPSRSNLVPHARVRGRACWAARPLRLAPGSTRACTTPNTGPPLALQLHAREEGSPTHRPRSTRACTEAPSRLATLPPPNPARPHARTPTNHPFGVYA